MGPRAAVEIGSGALKLVMRVDGATVRRRYPTEMVQHLDAAGHLSEPGRNALDGALAEVARLLAEHGVSDPRVVGTAALRRVPSSEVADLVHRHLDRPLDVLDDGTEAELGYRAAVAGIAADPSGGGMPHAGADRPVVSFDIGFGSTELATGGDDGALVAMSLPIGAATITDHYLHADPPRADELSSALSVIELHFDDLVRERPALARALTEAAQDRADVVGLGAVRYVAEVELGHNEGDDIHRYWLERSAVEEVFRAVATESLSDRAFNPGLRAEHAEWIVGAMCILVEFLRRFSVPGVRVCTFGPADALIDP